ncbi:MAG: UDP-N-acetylmuramate dehydrogenase [Alphaproteobacteria bacterium]|nr:UDP-N-acetylmuramate dehydrogenase [Alphaproteobacteria bacterium]
MPAFLSRLRGEIIENAPLGAQSWFACGGAADVVFRPADIEDLQNFLTRWPHEEPLAVLGGLANIIIRDGGIRGAVIQPGKAMGTVEVLDGVYVRAGAGALNGTVAAAAMKAGIGGLEFLSGIPGTVGGALRMNAGAYGSEIKDILTGAYALDRAGQDYRWTTYDMPMSYRHTHVPDDTIFTGALFKGTAETYETVRARMDEIKARRNDTQPIREKTGGSTFANPSSEALKKSGLPESTRAWQVVEMVGGRGLRIGGAQMSEQHCNFMINTGNATAGDLEMLGEELRARALDLFGLDLHWEIKRVGAQL